jgi:hypothetical protein
MDLRMTLLHLWLLTGALKFCMLIFADAPLASCCACFGFVKEYYGYDRYPGPCHIIPNSGVIIMSLLYGGDFSKTINISNICGWDTDCKTGNAGTTLGVMAGLEGIDTKRREPKNDFPACSIVK